MGVFGTLPAERRGARALSCQKWPGFESGRVATRAAWQHRSDYDYLAELTTWSGRYAATAGVPARSTPQPDAMAAIPARTFAGAVLAQISAQLGHELRRQALEERARRLGS